MRMAILRDPASDLAGGIEELSLLARFIMLVVENHKGTPETEKGRIRDSGLIANSVFKAIDGKGFRSDRPNTGALRRLQCLVRHLES